MEFSTTPEDATVGMEHITVLYDSNSRFCLQHFAFCLGLRGIDWLDKRDVGDKRTYDHPNY